MLTVVPRYQPYEGVEPTGISVPLDLPQDLPQPSPAKAASVPNWAVATPTNDTAAPSAPAVAQDTAAAMSTKAVGNAHPAVADAQTTTPAGSADEQSSLENDAEDQVPAAAPGAVQQLAQHAELYHCWQGGVHRVFVDHPLFHSSGELMHLVQPVPAACMGAACQCSPAVGRLPFVNVTFYL